MKHCELPEDKHYWRSITCDLPVCFLNSNTVFAVLIKNCDAFASSVVLNAVKTERKILNTGLKKGNITTNIEGKEYINVKCWIYIKEQRKLEVIIVGLSILKHLND